MLSTYQTPNFSLTTKLNTGNYSLESTLVFHFILQEVQFFLKRFQPCKSGGRGTVQNCEHGPKDLMKELNNRSLAAESKLISHFIRSGVEFSYSDTFIRKKKIASSGYKTLRLFCHNRGIYMSLGTDVRFPTVRARNSLLQDQFKVKSNAASPRKNATMESEQEINFDYSIFSSSPRCLNSGRGIFM